MQLTIDVKDSVVDKVLYLLENLKSDVHILNKTPSHSLDIETISESDADYKDLLESRKERENHPENYVALDDIKWD